MSGLDGLGWPNQEDEPKPNKTMNSQLEIKLAPTPETDQCVKANKHLRFLQEDHYVGNSKTTHENPIVFLSRKLERERDVAQKAMGDARDILLDAMPDANAPTKILAEMIVAERDKYQEQADALVDRLGATQERMINAERERDRLLKHLNVLAYWRDISECDCHNPLPNGGCLRCDLDKVFNSNQQPK